MTDETRIEKRGGDRKKNLSRDNNAEWLSKNGGVRCKRIKGNGKRCGQFAAVGYEYCNFHGAPSASRMSLYQFENEETEKTFLRFRNAEDYASVKDELGIIRYCMQKVLSIVQASENKKGKPNLEALLLAAQLSKDVTQVAKDCNTIERGLALHISIDTLEMWLGQMVELLADAGASEKVVARFIKMVGKTQMPIGGRKSVRDLANEAYDEDPVPDIPDEELYDTDGEENKGALGKETAKATEAPPTVEIRRKKKKKKKKKTKDVEERKVKRRKQ